MSNTTLDNVCFHLENQEHTVREECIDAALQCWLYSCLASGKVATADERLAKFQELERTTPKNR